MTCPACGADQVAFPVPDVLQAVLPDDRPGASLCTNCLRVTPTDDPPNAFPDFTAVSDAFPQRPDRAVILAVLLALLDSPATFRTELQTVTDRAEGRGLDVFLFLDRLQTDSSLTPHLDLARRSAQLEQLLE